MRKPTGNAPVLFSNLGLQRGSQLCHFGRANGAHLTVNNPSPTPLRTCSSAPLGFFTNRFSSHASYARRYELTTIVDCAVPQYKLEVSARSTSKSEGERLTELHQAINLAVLTRKQDVRAERHFLLDLRHIPEEGKGARSGNRGRHSSRGVEWV